MDKLLWKSSEKLKENSLLSDFCRFVDFRSSNNFKINELNKTYTFRKGI